ncbi:rRNA maturation RNase YbeY [Chloroflexota bacterium]
MSNHEINTSIDPEFAGDIDELWLSNMVAKILNALNLPTSVELGVVITDNDTVRQLNRDYRDLDEYTDVLSFHMPYSPLEEQGLPFISPPDNINHLGEIVISYPQSVKQAAEHGHETIDELILLMIHGVLHLLAYDHELPEEELIMQAKANEIKKKVTITED